MSVRFWQVPIANHISCIRVGRKVSNSDAGNLILGRIILKKKVAIGPEVCRSSDTRAENLVEDYGRNPIRVALQNYTFYQTYRSTCSGKAVCVCGCMRARVRACVRVHLTSATYPIAD